jgi:hypothetical protein
MQARQMFNFNFFRHHFDMPMKERPVHPKTPSFFAYGTYVQSPALMELGQMIP